MEQLPGWNNYLGSNLRPQTTRAVTLPIELRGASTALGGDVTESTRTEDGVEDARQGAEGEGGKEGADLLRGGSRRRRDTDGNTSASGKASSGTPATWVWHDKMASVGL